MTDVYIKNCMIYWRDNEKLEECRFCKKPLFKPQGRGRIGYCTKGCGTHQLQTCWKDYINLRGLVERWEDMLNISRGMARSLIHQMLERGNFSARYTHISLKIFRMFILGYAHMDLVNLECLGDNIIFGQSFLHRRTCHQRCAWNNNLCSWPY